MDLKRIRGLLIDIDETITQFKPDCSNETGNLFDVLARAGVELGGLSQEESASRIKNIKENIRWWHWSDFIIDLGLDAKAFWQFAYEIESQYIEATGPELPEALHRMHDNGILLYISSNNPSSGILHKMRIAGVADNHGTTLFHQLLGVTELQAMKWEPIYWKKVLAHTALDGDELAVLGDNPKDDYAIPQEAGIAGTFLINRKEDLSSQDTPSLIHVSDFNQVADILLGARES